MTTGKQRCAVVLSHPFPLMLIGVLSIAWSAIFVRWTHTPGMVSAFYRVLIADIVANRLFL